MLLVYGVRLLVYGVRLLVYGVRLLVYGVIGKKKQLITKYKLWTSSLRI